MLSRISLLSGAPGDQPGSLRILTQTLGTHTKPVIRHTMYMQALCEVMRVSYVADCIWKMNKHGARASWYT